MFLTYLKLKIINRFFLYTFISSALLSCVKKSDDIRFSDISNSNQTDINLVDSFTISARTVKEDSLVTSQLKYQLLGTHNDPNFGTSKASIYAPLYLTSLQEEINKPLSHVDSAILYIPFVSRSLRYGDSNSIQNIDVLEMNEVIDQTKTYTHLSNFTTVAGSIGTYNQKFSFNDSIKIRVDNKLNAYPMGIKIKLSMAFATKLFTTPTGNLASQDAFQTYIKGIALVAMGSPSSGEGSVIATYIKSDLARIYLYYNDSLDYQYSFGSEIAGTSIVNKYEVTHTNNDLLNQLASSNGKFPLVYTQAMGGSKTYIQVPYLLEWAKKQRVAITLAEMYIAPDQTTVTGKYYLPERLLLVKPDPDNNKRNAPITDLLYAGYDSYYNKGTQKYRFSIKFHLQEILNSFYLDGTNNNTGFYLSVPTESPINGARAVIDASKIKLRIVYTPIK